MQIQALFCGVCHSDIHPAKNARSNTVDPGVPGHEVVGRVTTIGGGVTTHALGGLVGMGRMIDGCRHCKPCKLGLQNDGEGPNRRPATDNGPMVPAKLAPRGLNACGRDNTCGAYSGVLVVRDDLLIRTPPALKPEVAAPILRAGVTNDSPMKHQGVRRARRSASSGSAGWPSRARAASRAAIGGGPSLPGPETRPTCATLPCHSRPSWTSRSTPTGPPTPTPNPHAR